MGGLAGTDSGVSCDTRMPIPEVAIVAERTSGGAFFYVWQGVDMKWRRSRFPPPGDISGRPVDPADVEIAEWRPVYKKIDG